MINEVYLAIVYRPTSGLATGFGVEASRQDAAGRVAMDVRGRARCLRETVPDAQCIPGALRARTPRHLPIRGHLVFISAGISWNADQWRMAARSAAGRTDRPCARDHASILRNRSHRIPLAHRDSRGCDARNQGVSDAERRRHVQPTSVGAIRLRPDAILYLSNEGHRAGSVATAVQSNDERRRFRAFAGRRNSRMHWMR